jgi:hypothetical protein
MAKCYSQIIAPFFTENILFSRKGLPERELVVYVLTGGCEK